MNGYVLLAIELAAILVVFVGLALFLGWVLGKRSARAKLAAEQKSAPVTPTPEPPAATAFKTNDDAAAAFRSLVSGEIPVDAQKAPVTAQADAPLVVASTSDAQPAKTQPVSNPSPFAPNPSVYAAPSAAAEGSATDTGAPADPNETIEVASAENAQPDLLNDHTISDVDSDDSVIDTHMIPRITEGQDQPSAAGAEPTPVAETAPDPRLLEAQARATDAEAKARKAEEKIEEANQRAREAEAKAREAEARIEEAGQQVTQADQRISEAEARATDAEAKAHEADQAAREAQARAAKAETRAQEADQHISQAEQAHRQVVELKERINKQEIDMARLENRATTAWDKTMPDLIDRIESLEGDLSQARREAAELQAMLDAERGHTTPTIPETDAEPVPQTDQVDEANEAAQEAEAEKEPETEGPQSEVIQQEHWQAIGHSANDTMSGESGADVIKQEPWQAIGPGSPDTPAEEPEAQQAEVPQSGVIKQEPWQAIGSGAADASGEESEAEVPHTEVIKQEPWQAIGPASPDTPAEEPEAETETPQTDAVEEHAEVIKEEPWQAIGSGDGTPQDNAIAFASSTLPDAQPTEQASKKEEEVPAAEEEEETEETSQEQHDEVAEEAPETSDEPANDDTKAEGETEDQVEADEQHTEESGTKDDPEAAEKSQEPQQPEEATEDSAEADEAETSQDTEPAEKEPQKSNSEPEADAEPEAGEEERREEQAKQEKPASPEPEAHSSSDEGDAPGAGESEPAPEAPATPAAEPTDSLDEPEPGSGEKPHSRDEEPDDREAEEFAPGSVVQYEVEFPVYQKKAAEEQEDEESAEQDHPEEAGEQDDAEFTETRLIPLIPEPVFTDFEAFTASRRAQESANAQKEQEVAPAEHEKRTGAPETTAAEIETAWPKFTDAEETTTTRQIPVIRDDTPRPRIDRSDELSALTDTGSFARLIAPAPGTPAFAPLAIPETEHLAPPTPVYPVVAHNGDATIPDIPRITVGPEEEESDWHHPTKTPHAETRPSGPGRPSAHAELLIDETEADEVPVTAGLAEPEQVVEPGSNAGHIISPQFSMTERREVLESPLDQRTGQLSISLEEDYTLVDPIDENIAVMDASDEDYPVGVGIPPEDYPRYQPRAAR